jgi:hypothetical protein
MKPLLRAALCLALIIVIFHIAALAAEDVDGQNAPQANLAGKKRPDQGAAAVTFSPRPVYVGAKEGVDPPVDVTPTLARVEWNDVTFVSADTDKFTVTKLDATREVRIVGKAATDKDGVELQAKANGKIIGKVSVIVIQMEFDKVWDRNLDPLDNGNYRDYQKCIAIEHDDAAHKVNLLDYLKIEPPRLSFDDIKNIGSFHIAHQIFGNASIDTDSDLVYDDGDPGDTDIYAFGIELRWGATVLDRLIVVIFSGTTETAYGNWKTNNPAPPGWLGELPAVHGSLGPDNADPEPRDPEQWGGVNGLNNNYHYSAAFEMRSVVTAGGHGHQTCYDAEGNLIEDDGEGNQVEERRASCGTADAQHWSDAIWPPTHFSDDVQPFIRAAQLDGNPVDGALALNNPLIRWGPNLQAYLDRRPPHTANKVP